MSQQNYFTYNIIDTLYYNQPTGSDLVKVYGLLGNENFKRRNVTEYDKMTDEEKHQYDEAEKEFIKAVINRYIFDDITTPQIGDNHTYIDKYDPSDTENVNNTSNEVTYTYFKSQRNTGIELSDMISNVNGTHNYKLVSAKDIDFDNVILPNSAISNSFNWGGFDVNRRWGDKPIRINNTFELLNVIDYLLCACDNLWSELYKIKYSTNVGVQIWFTKNVTELQLINNAKKLVTQDFQINSSGRGIDTRMITYLDPFNYYTSMTNNPNHNFGIVTNFYKTDQDGELSFDRKIIDLRKQNIELMVILPKNKIVEDYAATTNQNINGQLQAIYAYKIGDELKFYPGSRIDTFTDENNVIIDSNALVDFKEKKLKSETFFKVDGNNAKYNLVYINFLDAKQLGLDGIEDPYFIYYINNDNKKVILSCNYKNSDKYSSSDIKTQLQLKLYGYETYSFYNLDNNALSDDMIYVDPNTLNRYPKYYVMVDEFHTSLEVSTPNSSNFSSSSQSITIYWYKNRNKLDCTITRLDKSDNEIEIKAEEDVTQKQSLSYHSFRYNVPDGQDVTFKFDSSYIALNNDNPMGIRLDDEYDDVMLYNSENLSDAEISKYYKYDSIETSGGQFKRIFEQFNRETFENNKYNYIATDNHNTQYKHTWVKNENPYKLTLTIENNEFNNQLSDKDDVVSEINLIKNDNKFTQTTYNTYVLNHELSDGVEQIKLDLRFKIEETSKVKASECIIPLNINKIYYPTINYYSKKIVELEKDLYSNIKYPTADNTTTVYLGTIHDKMFNKYGEGTNAQLNKISDIYNLMTGENNENITFDILSESKSYDCTVNNSFFEITYNSTNNIVNLLGGWLTEQYVSSYISHNGFADINLKVGDVTKIIKDSSTDSSIKPYIFNINGLGRNYRLHGNGRFVDDKWGKDPIILNDVKKYYNQFDLISVATLNKVVSINKQLKIKVSDGDTNANNYQLQNICLDVDENNVGIWDDNNMDFNSGLNIITQSSINTNTNNDEDKIYNDYSIRTLPFEIHKGIYAVECPTIFDSISQNTNTSITYYVPVTYMYINSSTFFPPLSTIPQGNVHDLNNNTDLEKYKNYVKCWEESNNNYHPVTLSMKLFDNTTIASPYYYESNEAVMKFNIKRVNPGVSISIGGTNNIIYVALNSRYYLSDFIRVSSGNMGENATVNNVDSIIMPSGSYFYYNDTYKTHVIAEIPANFAHNVFAAEHNAHYKYYTGDKTNLIIPDFTNQLASSQTYDAKRITPYPIFKKEIIDSDDNITYSTDLYNYDIYRISDINKVKFSDTNTFSAQVITISDESSENITNINDNGAVGIDLNKELFCIDINSSFIQNFADNKNSENNTFNIIMYQLNHNGLYGSKNYLANLGTTTGTKTKIAPIVRKKITEGNFDNLNIYSTVEYSGGTGDYATLNGTYEFFEFKYEDVVEISLKQKENPNDPDVWEVHSLVPGTTTIENIKQTLSAEAAYNRQLELFLLNSDTDFIANISHWTNYYKQNDDNSTINSIDT